MSQISTGFDNEKSADVLVPNRSPMTPARFGEILEHVGRTGFGVGIDHPTALHALHHFRAY